MAAKDDVGRRGEELAAEVLTGEGYRLLARNWRGRSGELDVVALDGSTLVAVEIKTRSSTRFGSPAEGVTPAKLARLRRLLGEWLSVFGKDVSPRFRELRVDVVAVTLPPRGAAHVDLLRGVS